MKKLNFTLKVKKKLKLIVFSGRLVFGAIGIDSVWNISCVGCCMNRFVLATFQALQHCLDPSLLIHAIYKSSTWLVLRWEGVEGIGGLQAQHGNCHTQPLVSG